MNKQTEALKMVTDILDDELWFPNKYPDEAIPVCFIEALKACKEALAQPAQEYLTRAQQVIRANNSAQEPVAVIQPDNYGEPRLDFIGTFKYRATTAINPDILLYTHPAPSNGMDKPLFARVVPWQGLSLSEINDGRDKIENDEDIILDDAFVYGAQWAEQALKEKNHG